MTAQNQNRTSPECVALAKPLNLTGLGQNPLGKMAWSIAYGREFGVQSSESRGWGLGTDT